MHACVHTVQAIALVTGRLLVLLRGDEKLSQACLPLLMDAVTVQVSSLSLFLCVCLCVCVCVC